MNIKNFEYKKNKDLKSVMLRFLFIGNLIMTSSSKILSDLTNLTKLKEMSKYKTKTKINQKITLFKLKVPYPIKPIYILTIPRNIFQTWHTKNLPPLMKKNSDYIRALHPSYNYYLYDDEDCRNFIKENYSEEILNAFDSLIPGAYKADLWRYCILYKLGGIYLDIKYKPQNNFNFRNLCEREHWSLDIDKYGVYNAIIVNYPNNPKLLQAINQIVENVKSKFYGGNALEPTGPHLLGKLFSQEEKNNFDMVHDFMSTYEYRFISLNGYIIFVQYSGYLDEHNSNKKVDYYGNLWSARQIYR